MSHFSDPLHVEKCRTCATMERRSEMIAAKRLPGANPRARGWFCLRCATMRGFVSRVPWRP